MSQSICELLTPDTRRIEAHRGHVPVRKQFGTGPRPAPAAPSEHRSCGRGAGWLVLSVIWILSLVWPVLAPGRRRPSVDRRTARRGSVTTCHGRPRRRDGGASLPTDLEPILEREAATVSLGDVTGRRGEAWGGHHRRERRRLHDGLGAPGKGHHHRPRRAASPGNGPRRGRSENRHGRRRKARRRCPVGPSEFAGPCRRPLSKPWAPGKLPTSTETEHHTDRMMAIREGGSRTWVG